MNKPGADKGNNNKGELGSDMPEEDIKDAATGIAAMGLGFILVPVIFYLLCVAAAIFVIIKYGKKKK